MRIETSLISEGFVFEQVGRPKGGQYCGMPNYPIKLTHPDYPDIVIQVGGNRRSTNMNRITATTLFLMAIEEVEGIKFKTE